MGTPRMNRVIHNPIVNFLRIGLQLVISKSERILSDEPQSLWVHVHDPCDETLHDAELAVDTDHHEHEEEDDGPDAAARHLEDNLGVGDEDEAGPTVDNISDRNPLVVSHVSEDAEGDHPGQETGPGVHKAGDDGVLMNVN